MSQTPDSKRIEVIDDTVVEMLQTKTPAERIAMTASANRTARVLLAAGLRSRHPDWPEARVQQEVIQRIGRGPG